MTEGNAVEHLVGKTLNGKWYVKKMFDRGENPSGSFFSIGYVAERDGREYFLKAYNLGRFFNQNESGSFMDSIGEMTNAFRYERDLSEHCKGKKVTRVAFVRDYGEEYFKDYTFGNVPYLIFDLASGDVRKALEFSENLDYAWRFKSLHDVSVGLKQLHKIKVSHQDLKPSNILLFEEGSKLGDIGRSTCEDIDSVYNEMSFSGDWHYSPPEVMYRSSSLNSYAFDCYMLGSLTVFYFTGISMNTLLFQHLAKEHRAEFWQGDYKLVEPYILDAFDKAIEKFKDNINKEDYREELSAIVKHLCDPIPEKRGHPKNVLHKKGNNYNLERFISGFNLLRHKAEIAVKEG